MILCGGLCGGGGWGWGVEGLYGEDFFRMTRGTYVETIYRRCIILEVEGSDNNAQCGGFVSQTCIYSVPLYMNQCIFKFAQTHTYAHTRTRMHKRHARTHARTHRPTGHGKDANRDRETEIKTVKSSLMIYCHILIRHRLNNFQWVVRLAFIRWWTIGFLVDPKDNHPCATDLSLSFAISSYC